MIVHGLGPVILNHMHNHGSSFKLSNHAFFISTGFWGRTTLALTALCVLAACGQRTVTQTNPETGVLQATGVANNRGNQGVWQHFHENGQLAATGTWLNDMQNGNWQGFYPDGNLHYRGSYQNGFRQGSWLYFYPNGNPQLSGRYERDRQVGNWQRWQPDGTTLPISFLMVMARLMSLRPNRPRLRHWRIKFLRRQRVLLQTKQSKQRINLN